MNKAWLVAFLIILTVIIHSFTFAQETKIYENPEAVYRSALELFDKEKYGSAGDLFDQLTSSKELTNNVIKANAQFFKAVCSFKLFNQNAEYQLVQYIAEHPSGSHINQSYFFLGLENYRKRRYHSAIKYFEQVDHFELSEEKKNEYFFKLAYSYFNHDQPQKARDLFSKVRGQNTKYAQPAEYYYAHISYSEGNLETALKGFTNLEDSRIFGKIVPYYIIQIYFVQEKYDEILEIAPGLLESSTEKRQPEIARLIGESYYRTGNFEQALPYLNQYLETTTGEVSREEHYQLAYAYYKSGNCQEAIPWFQKVASGKDSIAQNAHYHLGGCYVETGQKKFALNAFLSAYQIPVLPDVREDALFNYAKLAYELTYDPHNEAMKALKNYISSYPNSPRKDEAYQYLVNIALQNSNYKAALSFFESIENRDAFLEEKYQIILFNRGIELFNSGNYTESIRLLKKARENDHNKELAAVSNYWIGEAFYRQNNYWAAKKYYNEFLTWPGSYQTEVYDLANYNVGYTDFKRENYTPAITAFRKFVTNSDKVPASITNDAYLRLGDSYFILKQFENAISYYNQALKISEVDNDYALFQISLCQGALANFDNKNQTLKKLIREYPASIYVDDAYYELATTYLVLNDYDKSLSNFQKIINDYPQSSYVKKSMLKAGLVYYNSNRNDSALITLKNVVKEYPATPESKEALVSIRNIYVDMNRVDDFFVYAQNLSFANVTASEQDSITYMAAENKYMEGNCEEAIPSFRKYLGKFPNGAYRISANYYLAECLLKKDSLYEAIEAYNFITDQPYSKFTEKALVKAANLNYELGRYEEAFKDFYELEKTADYPSNVLEAIYGQMKINSILGKHEAAIGAAKRLLKNEKVTSEMILNAHHTLAVAYREVNEPDKAMSEAEIVVNLSKGVKGAEAKFIIASIFFEMDNYIESEEHIFELINDYSGYEYWKAKSFILLADIYSETDNIFQAKQTLKSIIDNYEGDDEIVETARAKLNQIIETERLESEQKSGSDTIPENEIEFDIQELETDSIQIN